MSASVSVSEVTPSIGERAEHLRTLLTGDPGSGNLISEFMPPDVARIGAGSVLDFSDWSQFSQWPQSA
jgi:hypothetical protein